MAKRVLVVDDDVVVTNILERGLRQNHYEVDVASDGKSALRKARLQKPDLVILDIMMPDIDGTEVAHKLRESLGTRDIPIIYLTALKDQSDASYDASPHSIVFAKPFDPAAILAKIQEII